MAGKRKSSFDNFDHPTNLHLKKEIIAMNNAFPNLVGYGVLCVLMEMCGGVISGSIPFDKKEARIIASMLSVDLDTFGRIIGYMETAGVISINNNFLTVELISKSIIRKRMRRDAVRQSVSKKREIIKRKSGIRVDVKESEMARRRRIFKEFDEILIFTDRIKTDAELKYPGYGAIEVYFKRFVQHTKLNYAHTYTKITHDNYVASFYVHMNQYKKPLSEALDYAEKIRAQKPNGSRSKYF